MGWLKSFETRLSYDCGVANQEVLAIAGTLRDNKGLIDLNLRSEFMMSIETWDAVCNSLMTQPTLQVIISSAQGR
jgi:hypothetical protein